MNTQIVIAAVSARPFVQAATAAGYDVVALDAFADSDTRDAAKISRVINFSTGHFDPVDLERAITRPEIVNSSGLAYGGGFEAAPELLEMVERHMPLIGNTPRVVRNLKRPRQFFMLLEILKIPHPEVSFKPVISNAKQSAAGWLYKQGGGSGGTHVRKALLLAGIAPEAGCYFQHEIKGKVVSLLFVADGKQAKAIGFSQQWTSPSPTMPYRYGGAVGNADLAEGIKQHLVNAAQQLTNAVGLRGLNSIDAIMHGDRLWVLEVNPRLSATFDLYHSSDFNLFELHMNACGSSTSADTINALPSHAHATQARAQQIVYAPDALVLPDEMEWPEWAADLPLPGTLIAVHHPVCTVLAEADNAEAARELVGNRASAIEAMLANFKIEKQT